MKGESGRGTKSLAELAAHRKGIDDAFLAGSMPSISLEGTEDVEFDQRNRWIRRTHQTLRCCVPKSKELSILVAGDILPRFFHALYRYHPWVWFFSEGSQKSTRVVRFVTTFKFLLTSLFVTTVLYDINYPSPQTCLDFNSHASECLATPSNILSGEPTCTYNHLSDLCTVRSPPGNPAFLILVAFLTVVVMIPFNVVFTLVLTLLCSKRPRLEALGLNSFDWLGSADPASKQTVSAAEESERLLAAVRSVQGALFHHPNRRAAGFCTSDEIEGVDHVLRKLGLVLKDNRVELTTYSRLWWTDVNHAIRYHVEKSLADARDIQRNLEQYTEGAQKEAYLVQHFLLNRFSTLYRVALSRYFAHRARDFPQTVHPLLWILAWLFIIASLIFFIAWILWWGNAHAHSATIPNWGANFALSNLQEVLIFSTARIFFINVLAIEAIRPQLMKLHRYLIAKADESRKKGTKEEMRYTVDSNHCLLQHLDHSASVQLDQRHLR